VKVHLLLLATAALGSAPNEVVVRPGETLAQVAERAMGDEGAATELSALNGLSTNAVAPGTALRLPGPERGRALRALVAARNAVSQAGGTAPKRNEAAATLKEAEQLFLSAKYADAAKAADRSWRLVSATAQENTRFAIEVATDGGTKVSSHTGQPVRVEREGTTRPVFPGQSLAFPKQENGTEVLASLSTPELVAPGDLDHLRFKPTDKGLGPVTLSWQPVPGAASYEVRVAPADKPASEHALSLKVEKSEAGLPPLPTGKYAWSVRAVGRLGESSERSPPRRFELSPESLKLDVRGTSWK
jgi:hypothetical protein